jgi:hypothetical protein
MGGKLPKFVKAAIMLCVLPIKLALEIQIPRSVLANWKLKRDDNARLIWCQPKLHGMHSHGVEPCPLMA